MYTATVCIFNKLRFILFLSKITFEILKIRPET